ncbi:FAD-dependent oxidoreductase [Nocardia sp. IFM 10818]
MRTLAVVGGGVIGLSAAWRAAESGWTVTLYDPAIGTGASWVAGGMLAPLSEGWPGEDAALEFGGASLARWPDFAARLKSATGVDVITADETLTVALDAADAADLRTIADWVNAHDLPVPASAAAATDLSSAHAVTAAERSNSTLTAVPAESALGSQDRAGPDAVRGLRLLDRAGVRAAEPSLGRGVRAGLLSPAEPAVDNRALVAALRDACVAAGVSLRPEKVHALDDLPQDRIVLAAGAAAAELWPRLPVRPVKGEILRLRRRPSAPVPPRRVIRARVHGRPIYLVPRHDGIVLGATQYEAGFDTAVTVAGVRDLITDAETVFPGIGEYEFAEATAGSRPGTPDNLPLIGHLDERVIAATGHGRNGILGVPVTADAVLALLADTELPEARAAAPGRFAAGRETAADSQRSHAATRLS